MRKEKKSGSVTHSLFKHREETSQSKVTTNKDTKGTQCERLLLCLLSGRACLQGSVNTGRPPPAPVGPSCCLSFTHYEGMKRNNAVSSLRTHKRGFGPSQPIEPQHEMTLIVRLSEICWTPNQV